MLYLLFGVRPAEGKTMNAVLLDAFAGRWMIGGVHIGYGFVVFTLATEAALLFVAAQAGFIDGPRVMSSMATDSWLPHRFAQLSSRLTISDGVLLMGGAALATLVYTRGNLTALVTMYSINVFVTFSLSQFAMLKYWITHREAGRAKGFAIHGVALALCLGHPDRHRVREVRARWMGDDGRHRRGGDVVFPDPQALQESRSQPVPAGYDHGGPADGAAGGHSDDRQEEADGGPARWRIRWRRGACAAHPAAALSGPLPQHRLRLHRRDRRGDDEGSQGSRQPSRRDQESLEQYVSLAHKFGLAAEWRMGIGTDVLDEGVAVCRAIAADFPRAVFFSGKLIFEHERFFQRLLHNETAYQLQRRLQFNGMPSMVLPLRVMESHATAPIAAGAG